MVKNQPSVSSLLSEGQKYVFMILDKFTGKYLYIFTCLLSNNIEKEYMDF